jgi:plasmid maintenance system antidote protein VapI
VNLSDQIREAIKANGQSVYRIALSVAVEEKSLYRFMQGKAGLSQATFDRLAVYLGLRVTAAAKGEGVGSVAQQ